MEREPINVAEVRQILDTLPIGYYCGRRVECKLNLNRPYTDYDEEKDVINFSYPHISKTLSNAVFDTSFSKENLIRSALYKEVSHLLLTPNSIPMSNERSVYKIFEDERVETVLKDYYYGTNFKKNLLYADGGTIPTPRNDLEKFRNFVRYRMYSDNPLAKKIDKIIEEYKDINATSSGLIVDRYCEDIDRLFEKFRKEVAPTPPSATEKSEKEEELKQDGNSNGEEYDNETANGSKGSQKSKDKKGDNADEQSKENADGEGMETEVGNDGEESEGGSTSIPSDKEGEGRAELRKQIAEIAKDILSDKQFEKYYNALNAIISQYNKKNRGGNSMLTYSGILNPRNCVRDDYRFFERACTVNGNNRFGTLHLNFFLDDSGSFARNDKATNIILRALEKIESENDNFSFDVYFVAEGIQKAEKDKRRIDSVKGNWLVHEIYETFRKAQIPTSYNYNIVLFDGDAFSRDVSREIMRKIRPNDKQNFRAFDTNNTTIISDSYNHKYIDTVVTSANVVYTSDYVEELGDNIIKALAKGFR